MRQSYEAIIWGNLISANVFLCFTLLFVKDFRLDFSPSPHPFWWKKAFRSKLKKKNIKKATNNVEKNLFYFRKWDFLAVLLKKFKKQPPEFLWHMLKKLLVFQEGTDKARKTKKKSAWKKFLVSLYSSKA